MNESPDHLSLAAEAYSIVRQRILRGELTMGQVVSRRKLASELGMSFLPVSEALLRLEFEGLLESRPRAGTRVRIPTADDVRGHYVVREALEVQAARLFCAAATPEEKAELQRLAARVDTMAMQADSDRFHYLSLHEKLHRRIADCARCPSLSEAIEKTHALASTWMCVARPSNPDQPKRTPHQDLVEALSSGEPQRAAEAMRSHILSSQNRAIERLKPYFRLQETHGTVYPRSAKKQVNAKNPG
jgi:GntR family transcriptional regulator, rspAB operon transcriptional repressor